MIETFVYLGQNFEKLNAYEADFKFSSEENGNYKETYKKINNLCKENGLDIPYVFFQNKVYFLAESESISDKFIKLLGEENRNKKNVVISVNEKEILFMRLLRNWILLKTAKFNPQMTKYGLAYPIDILETSSSLINLSEIDSLSARKYTLF